MLPLYFAEEEVEVLQQHKEVWSVEVVATQQRSAVGQRADLHLHLCTTASTCPKRSFVPLDQQQSLACTG
jgi:hypothetical protein